MTLKYIWNALIIISNIQITKLDVVISNQKRITLNHNEFSWFFFHIFLSFESFTSTKTLNNKGIKKGVNPSAIIIDDMIATINETNPLFDITQR